tara:strand:+ start:193 stop:858 length:666 start_codon:yes stop_codon:yes gene_type:complete
MTIKNYIKNKKTTHFTTNNIEVFVKDAVPANISVKNVILSLSERIPKHLLRNVESIYVGQFKFLKDRDMQASYENSSIFVTNEQENETDMVDDMIHEVAHSVEELYADYLYSDNKLENEFLAKRKNMWYILKSKGHDLGLENFLEVEYNQEFDEFLYDTVGYPVLSMLTANIFHSPYAGTSLSEYFADGFEAFYMNDEISKLKNISPNLYQKIIGLLEEQQ